MDAEREGEDVMGRMTGFAVLVAALILGACTDGADSGGITTSTTGSAVASTTSTESADSPTKILFVGNSLTLFEGGLKKQLSEIAASATPPPSVETEESATPGMTLEVHWNYSLAPEMIANGVYDFVILQGYLIEAGVESFQQHVRAFAEATRDTGAEPILFMT
jgi:hypothetical protein